jgi:hypothetical protein
VEKPAVITAPELQDILRKFDVMSGVNVDQRWPLLAPTKVVISGALSIYGKLLYWEVEQDLTELQDADDIAKLIASLQNAFDRAEAQA